MGPFTVSFYEDGDYAVPLLEKKRHMSNDQLRTLMEQGEEMGCINMSAFNALAQELELDAFGWLQSTLNTVSSTPNVLFNAITKKPTGVS